ncbi:MAG: VPDSG-CTERM sorting domain-containing protein [Kiritimatiellia bacterium]
MRRLILLTGLVVLWLAAVAPGLDFPTGNITLWDTRDRDECPGTGQGLEDDEVEAATLGQEWDLEAFFWDDGKLWVVGGFNFRDGVPFRQSVIHAGDIFLDLNGDARLPGHAVVSDPITGLPVEPSDPTFELFDWELALAVDWEGATFDVVRLDYTGDTTGSRVRFATMDSYQASNPYRYYDGGTVLLEDISFELGSVAAWPGLSDWGNEGVGHYYAAFDLGSLGVSFRKVHMTMECGNDDLYGRVPDAGATLTLFGLGIAALCGFARKFA